MIRLELDEYFSTMAVVVALRSTCNRRAVGCVLTDTHNNVIATGYNGPARGMPHCIDTPCPGASWPSGTGLDKCEAIHAEQNALLQCRDVNTIKTAYCTTMPCVTCAKLLMNTSCEAICFIETYPHQSIWTRNWRHYDSPRLVTALQSRRFP